MNLINASTVETKRAVVRNAAEHHEELEGTFYLSDLLAACGATTGSQFRAYRDLVDELRLLEHLLPGRSEIPSGFESRAEADDAAESREKSIDHYLRVLVPDAPRVLVKVDEGTGDFLIDVRVGVAS